MSTEEGRQEWRRQYAFVHSVDPEAPEVQEALIEYLQGLVERDYQRELRLPAAPVEAVRIQAPETKSEGWSDAKFVVQAVLSGLLFCLCLGLYFRPGAVETDKTAAATIIGALVGFWLNA